VVREGIEAHVGMLTCQVLELTVQLQAATEEIARMRAALTPPEDPPA
jgi:hypothetical protein